MHDAIAIQYNAANEKVCAHVVSLPDVSDNGFYQDIRSWSAFGNLKFPIRWRFATGWFRTLFKDDYEMDRSVWKKTCKRLRIPLNEVPELRHPSLQEFYDHIGYDRKSKRITKEPKQ